MYRGSVSQRGTVRVGAAGALKITLEPITLRAFPNWSTTFAGRLTDEMGNGIPGQEIKLYLNGEYKLSVKTDRYGDYALAYAWTLVGDYTYELRYETPTAPPHDNLGHVILSLIPPVTGALILAYGIS